MSLPSISVRRPVTVAMFFIAIVLLGIFALQNLALDFLPSIPIPRMSVQTNSLGIPAGEIEKNVTEPIESALKTLNGVKRVTSISREGSSFVTLDYYSGTDMDYAELEMREKLDQLQQQMPKEVRRSIIVREDPESEPIMTAVVSLRRRGLDSVSLGETLGAKGSINRNSLYTLTQRSGSNSQLVELKEICQAIVRRHIEQVNGVARTVVLGGLDREIHVDVDQRKVESYDLSLGMISRALENANSVFPGGTIRQGRLRYSIRTVGEYQNLNEILETIVTQLPSGRVIRVKDVGMITDTTTEQIGFSRFNGNEILSIQIYKQTSANAVLTSQLVHEVIAQLNAEYPEVHVEVIDDQASYIKESISDVLQSVIWGGILAFLVLFLFLRKTRYSLIIGLTTPISLFATFLVMSIFRITLNIVSLTGLALGIGMLGDNAIIMVENMTRLREQGMPLADAAIKGASDINLAVTASTFTNLAVFLPIVFVQGISQQLFIDMGITMSAALLVSLVVAMSLVPMLISREASGWIPSESFWKWLKENKGWQLIRPMPFSTHITKYLSANVNQLKKMHSYSTGLVDRIGEQGRLGYIHVLDWALLHRYQTIAGSLGLFTISIVAAFFIASGPAPDIDLSRFTIEIQLPKGALLESTSVVVQKLEEMLIGMPSIGGVYSTVGITDENQYSGLGQSVIEKAKIEVTVKEGLVTEDLLAAVRKQLTIIQSSLSGTELSIRRRQTTVERILRRESDDISIRVIGPDLILANKIASNFKEEVQKMQGVVDVRTIAEPGTPEYELSVNRERALQYGIPLDAIIWHLKECIRGIEATYLTEFDKKTTVRVQWIGPQKSTIDDLLSKTMMSHGTAVPLHDLVSYHQIQSPSEIWRENGQHSAFILANVNGRTVQNVVEDIARESKKLELPHGYYVTIGGENEEIQESFRSLVTIIIFSVILVYMILASEYESVLYPLVILLTSPLAFVGAILAMVLTGQQYNVMSLIGIVIMIGAVDNDAVVAVDIITSLRSQGVGLLDSVRTGMSLRLRPIIMTTSTTILGMIPLIFEIGTSSQLVRSLTIPLTGGLLSSTIFTLILIPVVYTFIDRWSLGRQESFSGKK